MEVKYVKSHIFLYLHRIHTVTFLSFRAYNTDNQLITDTHIVYDIAAMRSVSLRLQSLNQKTLTEYHRFITESFTRIRF